MLIRRIKETDRDIYMRMTEEFYSSPAVLHTVPEKFRSDTFEEIIKGSPFADCLLFEENGKTVGYALLAKTFSQEAGGTVVWVEELMLMPEYRGKGAGTSFFEYLKANYPAKRYRLEAEPENEGAVRLYKRIGFEELGYTQYVLE